MKEHGQHETLRQHHEDSDDSDQGDTQYLSNLDGTLETSNDGIPSVDQDKNNPNHLFGSERGLFAKFTQIGKMDTLHLMHAQAQKMDERNKEDNESLNSSFMSVRDYFGELTGAKEGDGP